jgi:hypothetical protein
MAKKDIDWEAIEREYRIGIRSTRDLAAEFGVSHVTIHNRAQQESWDRDLAARIKVKAEAKINRAAINTEINSVNKAAEREIIEANSEMQSRFILESRADIAKHQEITTRLLEELEAYGDELGKKAQINKMLAETRKTLIALQREALGIDSMRTIESDDMNISVSFVSP